MPRRQPSWFSQLKQSCRGVVLLAAALVPGLARADVEWHPDLDTAQAAARISHRPVLAVFVASWDADTAAFEAACLGSPEAEAVLATCFEPVRIDIDDRPELARTAGVTHVPTACVLSADDAPLARFEMPDSPAAFVTAAILAARGVAAEHEAGPTTVSDGRSAPTTDAQASAAAVFGGAAEPAPMDNRPPRGSLARVTAKVRDLSAFAMNQGRPKPTGRPVALAPTTQPVIDPPSAPARSSWPAETSVTPPTVVAERSTIEPSASTLVTSTTSPWLDTPTQQSAQQPTQQPAQQPSLAAAPPAAAPLPTPAPPEGPQSSWQSRFIAALQKPFGWGAKDKDADPPTMPPARPVGPLEFAADPAPAAPQSAPEVDPHGSMPLGLEGYCPVTLVDRSTWQEGRAQWGARHRGRTYLFAGPTEQQAFLADPDRYAPALSGDDPVLALDRSSCTPGQRRYGVTYRSRMYLFATTETRDAFTADPDRYAARIAVAERLPPTADGTRRY